MSQSFADIYKTLSDIQLVAILNQPEDYLPEAVEAAQAELDSRQLSADALELTQQKVIEKEEADNRRPTVYNVATNLSNRFSLQALLPEKSTKTDKTILLITLWLGATQLPELYRFYQSRTFFQFQGIHGFIYLIVRLTFIAGYFTLAYFFNKRKRATWIILAVMLYAALWGELVDWGYMCVTGSNEDTLESYLAANWSYLLYIASSVLVLYFMYQPRMQVVYKVTKKWKFLVVVISLGLYFQLRLLGLLFMGA